LAVTIVVSWISWVVVISRTLPWRRVSVKPRV
jgi:hypothetical protein